MGKSGKQIQKAADFIKQYIRKIRNTNLFPGKYFHLKLVKVSLLSIRSFDEDKHPLRNTLLKEL